MFSATQQAQPNPPTQVSLKMNNAPTRYNGYIRHTLLFQSPADNVADYTASILNPAAPLLEDDERWFAEVVFASDIYLAVAGNNTTLPAKEIYLEIDVGQSISQGYDGRYGKPGTKVMAVYNLNTTTQYQHEVEGHYVARGLPAIQVSDKNMLRQSSIKIRWVYFDTTDDTWKTISGLRTPHLNMIMSVFKA